MNRIEVVVRPSMEARFSATVEAFDPDAKISKSDGIFIVETRTSIYEIRGWTSVASAEEILEKKDSCDEVPKDGGLLTISGSLSGPGFGNWSVSGGGYTGTIINPNHNNLGANLTNVGALISSMASLPDGTGIIVNHLATGVMYALFEIKITSNSDIVMDALSSITRVINLGDFRAEAHKIANRMMNLNASSIFLNHPSTFAPAMTRASSVWYNQATNVIEIRV